jgi:hypothetical protein
MHQFLARFANYCHGECFDQKFIDQLQPKFARFRLDRLERVDLSEFPLEIVQVCATSVQKVTYTQM